MVSYINVSSGVLVSPEQNVYAKIEGRNKFELQRFPIIVLHFVRESPSRHSRFLVEQLTGMSIFRPFCSDFFKVNYSGKVYYTNVNNNLIEVEDEA